MIDPGDPSPQRFPFVAAVFCAACVGAAVWLFFTCSYARDVKPGDLRDTPRLLLPGEPASQIDERWLGEGVLESWEISPPTGVEPLSHPMLGRYVRLRGARADPHLLEWKPSARAVYLGDPSSEAWGVWVWVGDAAEDAAGEAPEDTRIYSGRVVYMHIPVVLRGSVGVMPAVTVDTTRSRWTGESVAGLVVGAMGVLVFGMTFRHWLAQRRASAGPGEEAGS